MIFRRLTAEQRPVEDVVRVDERTFVIEQNRDAQLKSLITIELHVAPDSLTSILDYGGMPLTAKVVVDAVTSHLAGVPA